MDNEIEALQCFLLGGKMAADYVMSGLYILRHLFFRGAFVYSSRVSIEVMIGLRGRDRSFASYCFFCSVPSIASYRERPDKELFREIRSILWKLGSSIPN